MVKHEELVLKDEVDEDESQLLAQRVVFGQTLGQSRDAIEFVLELIPDEFIGDWRVRGVTESEVEEDFGDEELGVEKGAVAGEELEEGLEV